MGYTHEVVNHSLHYKDPETGAHTNTVEGAWRSQYKSQISVRSYRDSLLDKHLYKRMWLKKYRRNSWNAFWRALSQVDSKKELMLARPSQTI